jgi:hypothetical protein
LTNSLERKGVEVSAEQGQELYPWKLLKGIASEIVAKSTGLLLEHIAKLAGR